MVRKIGLVSKDIDIAAMITDLSLDNTAGGTDSEVNKAPTSNALFDTMTAHGAAADPHTVYQKESEKDAASGYLGLDASKRPVLDNDVSYAAKDTGGTARNILTLTSTDEVRLNTPAGNDIIFTEAGAELVRIANTTGNITFTPANAEVDGRDLSVDGAKLDGIAAGANLYVHPNHSGEVTSVADGATTIANNAVTLAKLATQAAETVLANATAGAAVPTAVAITEQTLLGRITGGHIVALTVAQCKTLLNWAADIATHAALTATHGVAGTIAGLADIATHAALTATHGVAGTIAGLADIVTHAALTTGVHGAGANTILYSNHNVALSSTIHPNTTLARAYLAANSPDLLPQLLDCRVELDTESYDLGNNFTTSGYWVNLQADGAGCNATTITDASAGFVASLKACLVQYASNSGFTTNVGTAYIRIVDSASQLTIAKSTGADMANSYYYRIKYAQYVAPVAGYYPINWVGSMVGGADGNRYYVTPAINGVAVSVLATPNNHLSHSATLRVGGSDLIHLAANDIVFLVGNNVNGTTLVPYHGGGSYACAMSIYCVQKD